MLPSMQVPEDEPAYRAPNSPLGTLWLAGCLLVAAFFGYQAARDATAKLAAPPITPVSHVSPAAAEPQLVERPIEEIQVGERMYVEEGYGEEDYSLGADVDPATWRKLTLRAEKPAGGHADVELLRPLAWLEAERAEVGGTVYISVPECGIDGDALVLSIAPCPPVRDGPGRVVTGTFHHSSGQVLDVSIEGVDPIGTTANHPFWSEDRQAFIRADRLYPGERVRTLDGTPRVTSIIPRASPQPVYNLEIQVAHVYHVTPSGVLVHNGGDRCVTRKAVDASDGRVGRTPYHDPQRPSYANGRVHQDHGQARALGGADHPSNIRPLAAETNLRKGGHEGALKADEQDLIRYGMSPADARSVIQGEIDSLRVSPPPRPTDPNILDALPTNPLDQGHPF